MSRSRHHDKFYIFIIGLFFATRILPGIEAAADSVPPVTASRRADPRYAGDPLAVRALNPVFDTFPDSSLVDFSFLLDPPAGKHGFVELGQEGHFRYSKTGQRAKFWGVTIAATHAGDIEKRRIEQVVDVLARGGCNMLRLHEMDNRGGEKYNLVRRNIIDEAYPNNNISTEFDAEYRDRADYWIACAQKKGIYVYLVLRGYRTFREGDGVASADKLDRAAKPYAFFDDRLIELQKQYADEWLFKHVNPYTGKPNGLNPAVAILEIENEDSLFYGHVAWREFAEPYHANFHKMWNAWLAKEYGSTAALRKAWTNSKGECALASGEKLEEGGIGLPGMTLTSLEQIHSIPWTDPVNSPARCRDGARFAAEVQRRYFATMRGFLRSKGCRIPLDAVVHSGVLIDTWTTAREFGTSAENAYLDHPGFLPGSTWVGKPYFSNMNYISAAGTESLAAQMARYRWSGVALICREWTLCWPNEQRVISMPDMASQAAMQDYDCIIHFAYYTWGNPDMITPFGQQADPTRWGMNGYAAMMFIGGQTPADTHRVEIGFNDQDLFTWASCYRPLHRLAWTNRIANWNPDTSAPTTADIGVILRISSGRSGTGKYEGGNLLLFDPNYAQRAQMPDNIRREGLIIQSGYDHPWIYKTDGFPLADVKAAGYQPLLESASAKSCKGFHDTKRNCVVLADVDESSAAAVARDFAAAIINGKNTFNTSGTDPAELTALDGRIRRNPADGMLRIGFERVCALAGEFQPETEYKAGVLEVSTSSPIATVIASSLDGRPLAESRRFAVKMATVARNRGQTLEATPPNQPGAGKFVLTADGAPPVQTLGKPCDAPTTIKIGGKMVAEAYLMNGTWEMVIDRDSKQCDLACDTPNVRFVVDPDIFGASAPETISIRKFYTEYPPADANQAGYDFIYPGFAKYVRMSGKQ